MERWDSYGLELLEQYVIFINGIKEAKRTLPTLKHMRDAMLHVGLGDTGRIVLRFQLPGLPVTYEYEILAQADERQTPGRGDASNEGNELQPRPLITLSQQVGGQKVTIAGEDRQWYRRPITDGQLHDLISVLKRGVIGVAESDKALVDSIRHKERFESVTVLHMSADIPRWDGVHAEIACRDDAIQDVFDGFREIFFSILPQENGIDDLLGDLSWVSYRSCCWYEIDGTTGLYTGEATALRRETDETDELGTAFTLTCDIEDRPDGGHGGESPWEDDERRREEWEMALSADDWDRLVDAVRQVDANYRERKYVGHRNADENQIALSLTVQLASGWAMLFQSVGVLDSRLLPITEFFWDHGVSRQEIVVADE